MNVCIVRRAIELRTYIRIPNFGILPADQSTHGRRGSTKAVIKISILNLRQNSTICHSTRKWLRSTKLYNCCGVCSHDILSSSNCFTDGSTEWCRLTFNYRKFINYGHVSSHCFRSAISWLKCRINFKSRFSDKMPERTETTVNLSCFQIVVTESTDILLFLWTSSKQETHIETQPIAEWNRAHWNSFA